MEKEEEVEEREREGGFPFLPLPFLLSSFFFSFLSSIEGGRMEALGRRKKKKKEESGVGSFSFLPFPLLLSSFLFSLFFPL